MCRGSVDGLTRPSFYEAARTALGERYAEVPFTGYTARTLLVAGPSAGEEATTAVLRTLLRAQREIAADPAGARKDVIAQSKGALQAGHVDAFMPRYGYGASLSPELADQLAQEAAWAKAAQSALNQRPNPRMSKPMRTPAIASFAGLPLFFLLFAAPCDRATAAARGLERNLRMVSSP